MEYVDPRDFCLVGYVIDHNIKRLVVYQSINKQMYLCAFIITRKSPFFKDGVVENKKICTALNKIQKLTLVECMDLMNEARNRLYLLGQGNKSITVAS